MKKSKDILTDIIKSVPLEAAMWFAALTYLLIINPYQEQIFTFCPFHAIGIENCPGCGIGRSISFFYHGDFLNSIKTHPLGIAAFLIISFRIFNLIRNKYKLKKGEAYYG